MKAACNHRRIAQALSAAAALTGLLAGCAANSSESSTAAFFADPSKYILYNCVQLGVARKPLIERELELRGLMAKAERGPGGQAVSALAYRSDYLAARGELDVIAKEAARKQCTPASMIPPRRTETTIPR